MEEADNNIGKEPKERKPKEKKEKSEKRRSSKQTEVPAVTVDSTRDEVKKFKENLLQSVPSGESILSGNEASVPVDSYKPRSSIKLREGLSSKALAQLDEKKIYELKEAFLLFDLDGDGVISFDDLRGTLISLGETVDEKLVRSMLSEASNPLDFDGFVRLLGHQTVELDNEETLVAALSRWDQDNTGYIPEERIRHDLMTWGDRFTEKETDYALDEAPVVYKWGANMIDYQTFVSQLSGLRKPKKN